MSGLVALFGSTTPLAPRPGEPLVLTVLSWAGREIEAALTRTRRQIDAALFNDAPTAAPLVFGESTEGIVTGSLGAADAENDPVRYRVVAGPEHGSVVVHDDGTFTYTPSEALAAQGGTDTFSVRIADTGYHLHLFHGDGTTTVPITVTVAAGEAMSVGGLPVAAVASSDGSRVYVVDAKTNSVKVYDAATNTPLGAVRVGAFPYSIAISPDNTRAYVVNSDGRSVSVIDTTTLATVGDPIALGGTPTGVAVSPDGTRLYVTNGSQNRVAVIDTTSRRITSAITVGTHPYGVAVDATGERVYVTNEYDDSVSVIDAATNKVVDTIAVGDAPTAIAINPANGRAYVTNTGAPGVDGDGSVSVFDTATNTVIGEPIPVGEFPIAVAFSADGNLAFVAIRGHDSVAVIDTMTNAVVDTDPTSEAVDPLAAGNGPAGLAVIGNSLFVVHSWDGTALDVPIVGFTAATDGAQPAADAAPAAGAVMVVAPAAASGLGRSAVATATANATANASSTYEPDSKLGSTGFNVYNNSSASLILTGYSGGDRPQQGAPEIGHILGPGQVDHFEVNTNFTDQEEVQPIYTSQATGETFTAQLYGATTGVPFVPGDAPSAGCAHAGGSGTCSTGNLTDVYFQKGSNSEPDSSLGSNGFDIYNLTSSALTFKGYASEDRPQFGVTVPGDPLLPGDAAHFEINRNWEDQDNVVLTFESSTGETWTASLFGSTVGVIGTPDFPSTQCSHSGGSGSCSSTAAEVDFLDAPDTVISVSAADPTTKAFSDACASSAARCVFKPTSNTAGFTDPKAITQKNNQTDNPISQTLTLTETVSTTKNLTLSAQASVKVLDLVNTQITATYGISVQTTNTFTDTVSVPINPGETLEVFGQYPINTVVGDLTVLLGDTTITLTGATFVIPDPNGQTIYTYKTVTPDGTVSGAAPAQVTV